jgi:hypothetical protein
MMKALAGTVVAAGLLLAGCGNAVDADVNGETAVTLDAAGQPVVLVAVCHSSIDAVVVSRDRKGLKETEPNVDLGTWTASKPMKGIVSLPLADPGSDWSVKGAFDPEDAKGYIVIAYQAKADVEAQQVYFHGSDLAKLASDEVLVGDREVQKRTKFEHSCT